MRCLLENAGLGPANLFCFTYDSPENQNLIEFLRARDIRHSFASMRDAPACLDTARFAPHLVVSLHYRHRIPTRVLERAPRGGINAHPSLLPRYRGCFSVPWAIINGERETGITYHRMVEGYDEGAIVLQQRVPIGPTETAYSLFHRLIDLAIALLPEAIVRALDPEFSAPDQIGPGTYFPRKVPFGGVIDPQWSTESIERFIRAMTFPPKPPAKFAVNGRYVDITSLDEYRRWTGGSEAE